MLKKCHERCIYINIFMFTKLLSQNVFWYTIGVLTIVIYIIEGRYLVRLSFFITNTFWRLDSLIKSKNIRHLTILFQKKKKKLFEHE